SHCHALPPDLPSFPTRRSSDLCSCDSRSDPPRVPGTCPGIRVPVLSHRRPRPGATRPRLEWPALVEVVASTSGCAPGGQALEVCPMSSSVFRVAVLLVVGAATGLALQSRSGNTSWPPSLQSVPDGP